MQIPCLKGQGVFLSPCFKGNQTRDSAHGNEPGWKPVARAEELLWNREDISLKAFWMLKACLQREASPPAQSIFCCVQQ